MIRKAKRWSLLVLTVLMLGACHFDDGNDSPLGATPLYPRPQMQAALERGLGYIHSFATCAPPAYPVWVCPDGPETCFQWCNDWYMNAQIYLTLLPVETDPAMAQALTAYLEDIRYQSGPEAGFWSYWGFSGRADVDDAAVALMFLNHTGTRIDMTPQILALRKDDGLIYTWVLDEPYNQVDCAVSAMILEYFNLERIELKDLCAYLTDPHLDIYGCDVNYPYWMIWLYWARAYQSGVECLEPRRKEIIGEILQRQGPDGGWEDENISAFHAATLAYYRYHGPEVPPMIHYLLDHQHGDGSWSWGECYVADPLMDPDPPPAYTGSEAITAALAVYALHYYLNNP
jgi:hypothetical protein